MYQVSNKIADYTGGNIKPVNGRKALVESIFRELGQGLLPCSVYRHCRSLLEPLQVYDIQASLT